MHHLELLGHYCSMEPRHPVPNTFYYFYVYIEHRLFHLLLKLFPYTITIINWAFNTIRTFLLCLCNRWLLCSHSGYSVIIHLGRLYRDIFYRLLWKKKRNYIPCMFHIQFSSTYIYRYCMPPLLGLQARMYYANMQAFIDTSCSYLNLTFL